MGDSQQKDGKLNLQDLLQSPPLSGLRNSVKMWKKESLFFLSMKYINLIQSQKSGPQLALSIIREFWTQAKWLSTHRLVRLLLKCSQLLNMNYMVTLVIIKVIHCITKKESRVNTFWSVVIGLLVFQMFEGAVMVIFARVEHCSGLSMFTEHWLFFLPPGPPQSKVIV